MQPEERTNIPTGWAALRELAEVSGRGLSPRIIDACWRLLHTGLAVEQEEPGRLTPEYGKDEYLLVVDRYGQPEGRSAEIVAAWRACYFANRQFGMWFREATLEERPVLLAARWLCHLAGLRHQTVEIFIDPPEAAPPKVDTPQAAHTLVQVRGMDKVDAPGAFDIPCAGHVSGLDGIEQSLEKELGEELNLRLGDLDDLRELARYISPARQGCYLLDEEYRYLYRAMLKPGAVGQIRFSDGEVGALALFNMVELRRYCQRFPERAASGLSDALGYYR